MRKVYENQKVSDELKNSASHLCKNLNQVVKVFHESQPFEKIDTSEKAFSLVSDPVNYFDGSMIKGTGVKPVKGLKVDPETIAKMFGVGRPVFISGINLEVYGTHGHIAPFSLPENQKYLFLFNEGQFSINEIELQKDIEKNIVYAETPEQIELLGKWEHLTDTLNSHAQFINMDMMDSNRLAALLGLDYKEGKFIPKYSNLASQIKSMVLVN
jgi:hypothetical protein